MASGARRVCRGGEAWKQVARQRKPRPTDGRARVARGRPAGARGGERRSRRGPERGWSSGAGGNRARTAAELFPPETRLETLAQWVCVGVTVVLPAALGALVRLWLARCCYCGRGGGRRTMVAPGRSGACMPRGAFEGDPRTYFRDLRAKKPLLPWRMGSHWSRGRERGLRIREREGLTRDTRLHRATHVRLEASLGPGSLKTDDSAVPNGPGPRML
nr:uncharacterized protein LOC120972775 [Aegilops tauschii subsp. strangulata]XP_040254226.1 uncharacterized protein LOC120972776 [Aegilops tauschii subsp. strangulata]